MAPSARAPALRIGQAALAALRSAAAAAYPEECCGLVVGRRHPEATVTRLIAAANRHPRPRRNFTVDPARHFALLRELRAQGAAAGAALPAEELLGHYHSHPDADAVPSRHDLARADDPALLWLIIEARGGQAGTVTVWLPRVEGSSTVGFDPVLMEVMPDNAGGAAEIP